MLGKELASGEDALEELPFVSFKYSEVCWCLGNRVLGVIFEYCTGDFFDTWTVSMMGLMFSASSPLINL